MSKKWIQTDDWKKEKHVPAIDIKKVEDGEATVVVTVGKEIAHPNTTAHHIKWLDLFFWPEGGKFPYEIGYATFDHHGESTEGPDTSGIYTEPVAKFVFKVSKPGTLMATSYCNIHGLWKNEEELKL
ncbi:MAG: desulfoferrodoxin family protein [Promethearchaeota archaeon]